jgi:hypothetical protein
VLNGVSMAVGVMEMAFYSSYTHAITKRKNQPIIRSPFTSFALDFDPRPAPVISGISIVLQSFDSVC